MTLIEGVGDEVTNFFIIVGVILAGWIAWCSTNISEQPLIHTVLILQHRTRTRIAEFRANIQQTGRVDSRNTSSDESVEEISTSSSNTVNTNEPNCTGDDQEASREIPPEETNAMTLTSSATSEEVLIEAMDSLNDNTRLLRRPAKLAAAPAAAATATATNESEFMSPPSESSDSVSDTNVNESTEIIVKLKFINDDQKLVTGRLKELLGDFKKRHFAVELDSRKRVRLIFNGQVLQPDDKTLEKCGLYNNCVVHCLVHPPLPASTSNAADNSSSIYSTSQSFQNQPTGDGISSVHNEWDLGGLLIRVLTLILALAWYSRYHYAQLFTATTTVALYALTAIFTLSVVGHFFPDRDSLRNIE